MKTALVYFTKISKTAGHVGGSEILLFLIIKELQARGYEVTVALQSGGDVANASKDYGVAFDEKRLRVLNLSEKGKVLRVLDRHLKFVWQWRLRRLGPKFDICISCANPVDFGRPGIHFIYILTLDEKFKAYFWQAGNGWKGVKAKLVFARDAIIAFLAGVRMSAAIVRDGREVILANSNFAKSCIESYYRGRIHEAFYPPTIFEPLKKAESVLQNLDIAYIGRFEPEKRVAEIVEIVRLARERSGVDFRLHLAGHCPETADGEHIRSLVERYPWANLEGTVVGDAKAAFLASCSFALHACKIEAFGISVTEYLKAGLVPIVPREGGSSEVVGLADLAFDSCNEAADILVRLAQDKAFYSQCTAHCLERAKVFSAEAYLLRQEQLMNELGI